MTVALVLLCLLIQSAPPQAPAIDPAIAAVVAQFFDAQEKEDAQGYLALWSPNGTPPRPEQLQFVFDQGDDKYHDLAITRVTVAGSRARVRVDVRRERTSAPRVPGGPPFVSSYPMSITLSLESTPAGWKLLSEGPAADDLAAALLEAASDEARETLLASDPQVAGLQVLGALARMGGAAAMRQDYTEARRVYDQLRFAARRGGFRKEEGEALQNIANAFYFQRRYAEALSAYEQRLTLERDRQDDAGMASALAGIATIRYSYAEYGEALLRYQEALALHEKTDDVAGIAFVSLSIGNIGYLQGDFPAAIAAYRRSLDLNRPMFNVDGESRALEGLGRVYMAQGDYAAALTAFDSVRVDPRMATLRGRLAAVAQSIGEVHLRLGNVDAARASYEESRRHFEAVGDLANVGRVLQGSAITEVAAARFPAAEDLYKRSAVVCASASDGDCSARASAGLAFAQSAQEKFWDAAASYRKAIEAFIVLKLREEAARSEIGLSQALVGAGDVAGGIQAASRARSEAVVMENDDVLWRALTAEARAIRKLGDGERALGVARAAASALDRLDAIAADKPATALPVDATGALATLAVLQAESGDARGAFVTAERLRRVDLRAALATNERDIAAGMTAEDRQRERELANAVSTLLARIAREKGLPKPDAARLAELQKLLEAATATRRTWMQELYERLPDLSSWRGLRASDYTEDLDAALPDSGGLVLAFVLDEDALLILAARRAATPEGAAPTEPFTIDTHVVPAKRAQIASLVASFQNNVLSDPGSWRKAAAELTAMWPEALRNTVAAASRVAVVPHDVLWRVPFDALPSGEGLVADHAAVTLAGSVAMLARASRPASPSPREAVLVGAPRLEPARTDRLRQVAPSWSLRGEDDAARELKAAGGEAAEGVTVFSGAAATEPAVRDAFGRSGLLHIAAPFRINAASPLFSSILLTGPEAAATVPPVAPADAAGAAPRPVLPNAAADGALELREVMNLTSAARLAVLSDGAATAMRDSAAAVDVVEWGWLAAGVRSMLVARWAAPPDSRDRLLRELHLRLRAGDSAALALKAAQAAVRANAATVAPVHWAGWMLLGAPR